MDRGTIAELLRPYAALSPRQIDQVSTYIDLLLKWNAKINLTAVRDPREVVARHFGESFFAAEKLLDPTAALSVIDLGSGAGFPGLPLAMFAPSARITLIESSAKKAAFLNEVITLLKLANAQVFSRRAETYPGTADLVIMRAVEKFADALPLALGLVSPGGRIALMIGATQMEQARALEALESRVRWNEPISVPGGHSRVLTVGTKVVRVD